MSWEIKIRPNQPRPEGAWRQLPPMFEIAGIHYRIADAERFVRAAKRCEEKGWSYWLDVVREPDNPHDSNAIAVMGVWTHRTQLLRRMKAESVQLGYIPREMAAEVPRTVPIAIEPSDFYMVPRRDGDGVFVSIRALLLLPGRSSGFWEGRHDDPFV